MIDGKSDWFIIHAPKKTKNNKAITNTVKCSHVSSILKTKNLYLVFDDQNGIGTVQDLIEKTLASTGWTLGEYDKMFERDGKTEKIRTIKNEGKAGAYKLITDICNLFSCFPVFDGESKTVSVYALNRRNELREMTIGKDIETLSVEFNSEDIITRLYVEGEYGDYGYVGIDDINPTGLSYLLNFDYYKSIGLFTSEHQQALDDYLIAAKEANTSIKALTTDTSKKENELNALWGQTKCVIYPASSGSLTGAEIIRGELTQEERQIAEGDTVTIVKSNGEYREQTAGGGGSYALNKTDAYVIKFITLPSALLGAKQVAIESKTEMIQRLNGQITENTPTNKKETILEEISTLQDEIKELYAPEDGSDGVYAMMIKCIGLALEINTLGEQMDALLVNQASVEATFYVAMGDLLKDGYWNDSNYTVGQEEYLYLDSLDMIEHMSRPQVKYSVSRVS